MGKASSAKKVARAARTGGKTKGQRKNIGFPAAIVAVVLLGVGLVTFARSTGDSDQPPKLGDHWHAAYGVYVCDRWVADLSDRGPDQLGIHTHDDGLIHIHPFLAGAAGNSATLGKFFEQVGMSVSGSSITLPEGGQFQGRKYVSGETTCGGEPGRVVVGMWSNAQEAGGDPDETFDSSISGRRLDTNFAAYTIAFVPEGAEIPPPPSAAFIVDRAVVDGGSGEPIQGVPEDTDLPADSTVPIDEEPPASEEAPDAEPRDGEAEVPASDPPEGGDSTAPPADAEGGG